MQWSRVVSLFHDDLAGLRTFDLATNLALDKALEKDISPRRNAPAWTMYFRPKDFARDHGDLAVEDHRLSRARLIKLGQQVSEIRR